MSDRLEAKRVLLISAYDTEMPVLYWSKRLQEMFPSAQWTQLGLAPDNFAWRVRGNALRLAAEHTEQLNRSYDLVIASSLVDWATLRGLVPSLAQAPSILYFHENPFAYAEAHRSAGNGDAQMTSLYSALAADACIFNSRHNLSSFMSGIAAMLDKYPEEAPQGVVQSLLAKSHEIPVPLCADVFEGGEPASEQGSLRILWNQRWGFDKGPDRLLAFVKALDHSDLDARLVLTGQRGRQIPASMAELEGQYGHRIAFNQHETDRQMLRARMAKADVVLSTAKNDFQGIEVMEAVAMGCVPLLPDRLSYPEHFPNERRYHSIPDADQEAINAVATLRHWRDNGFPSPPDMQRFHTQALVGEYEAVIDSVLH